MKTLDPKEVRPYIYKSIVTKIYDGDSITINWDRGGKEVRLDTGVRLAGIDAFELTGHERVLGVIARDYVRDLIKLGDEIVIETYKDKEGLYCRLLADIYAWDDGHWVCVNDILLEKRLAVPWNNNKAQRRAAKFRILKEEGYLS